MAAENPWTGASQASQQPADPFAAAAAPGPMTPPQPQEKKGLKSWSTKRVLRTLRMVNTLNGLLIILTAFLAFIVAGVNLSFTTIILATIIGCLGLLMTCAECNFANVQQSVANNIGCIHTFWGRTMFIAFLGTMCIAFDEWLTIIFGVLTLLNAVFNAVIICVHPAFKGGSLSGSSNPYLAYTAGEEEVSAYLQAHPELAQRAAAGAVATGVAVHNASHAPAPAPAPADAANPWG